MDGLGTPAVATSWKFYYLAIYLGSVPEGARRGHKVDTVHIDAHHRKDHTVSHAASH